MYVANADAAKALMYREFMYDFSKTTKPVETVAPDNLYKWNRNWFKIQKTFFEEDFVLSREKQIVDFAYLNGYNNVHIKKDTDILAGDFDFNTTDNEDEADLIIVTLMTISRLPCNALINYIKQLASKADLYICLNRHYLNIDDSYCDPTLNNDYEIAIKEWLQKGINSTVLDLSFKWRDRGDYFSWSIPDRHYFIPKL